MSINSKYRVPAVLLAAALSTAAATGVATAATPLPTAGTTTTRVVAGTTTSAKPSAFPAGGKGSGSEQMCDFYSNLLGSDQADLDAAKGFSAQLSADLQLAADKDAATDAGCVVID
jgi:hypothetical protein